MARREDLQTWVLAALSALGGSGDVVSVSRYIWEHYEDELRRSGDLFYTWQYDVRWAATKLRHRGKLAPAGDGRRGVWALQRPSRKTEGE